MDKDKTKDIVIKEKKRPTMEEQIEFVKNLSDGLEKNTLEVKKMIEDLRKELGINE